VIRTCFSTYLSSSGIAAASSERGRRCRGTSDWRADRWRPNSSSYSMIGSSYAFCQQHTTSSIKFFLHHLETVQVPSTIHPHHHYPTQNIQQVLWTRTAGRRSRSLTLEERSRHTSTSRLSYCAPLRPPDFPLCSCSYTLAFLSRATLADSIVTLLTSSSSVSRAARFWTPLLERAHTVGFCVLFVFTAHTDRGFRSPCQVSSSLQPRIYCLPQL
jgi:hypothetical protein